MRRCQWIDECPRLAERAVRIGLAPHVHDRALCDYHATYVNQLGFGKELTGWQARRLLGELTPGGTARLTA